MVVIVLAEGFEEVEALTPADVLRRGGIETVLASADGNEFVAGSHSITVKTDGGISRFENAGNIEMVILPGGMPGTKNLGENENVKRLVRKTYDAGGFAAAICAAPSVLGSMGLLRGKRAVCYPGFESALAGAEISSDAVVRDGNIITAKNAGAAMEFSFKLLEILKSKAVSDDVKSKVNA
jgi:4-methyl-5(b-hydroxyethyl)-thiazole monophosphate biosynthesis